MGTLPKTDRFALVVDLIPGYVSWIARDLRYLGVNQAIADAFGIDRASVAGTPLGFRADAAKDDFCLRVRRFFESKLETDSFEVRIELAEGERWHLVEARKYEGGKEALFVGIDITERKRIEASLAAEREQRIEDSRLASLGEMAASIAHEINSPLCALMGFADLVVECHAAPEKVTAFGAKIQRTAGRIAKIVKALQAQARKGDADPFLATALEEIVQDTTELCRDKFRDRNVELRLAALPPGFRFDCRATQISQVVLNLLKNACDAVEALPERWVELSFRDLGETFALVVTDSGPGIPAEVRTRLMQPFYTTKGVGKGTGLGLSLSRRICEEHGGTLTIEAECKNTRFVITLPKGQAAQPKSQKAA